MSLTSGGGIKPRSWTLYIPVSDNSHRPIKSKALQDLEDRMSFQFKGSTSSTGRGCYFSDESEKMECEPVKVVHATRVYEIAELEACDQFIEDSNVVDRLASDIQRLFGQEGVWAETYEIDSVYVGGPKKAKAADELVDEFMF